MVKFVNLFRSRIYSVLNDDHSHLFQILKELKRIASEKHNVGLGQLTQQQTCAEKLNSLIDDTAAHFSREEVLMRAFRYKGLDEHRNNHLLLLRNIQTFQSKLARDKIPLTTGDLIYLDAWLTNHIREDDRRLEDFLADHPMVEEPGTISSIGMNSLGPRAIAFGALNLMLWIKLCFLTGSSDKVKKNRDRALQSAASRLRHISRQNAVNSSPKQRQEQANKDYSGWYYGNY